MHKTPDNESQSQTPRHIPDRLWDALRPVTVVVGHYGAGKTNFSVNLAIDLAEAGEEVSLVDLDVVNPYFRASEQRVLLEDHGVRLVAPIFAEAGTSLDVPSLSGQVTSVLHDAWNGARVIVDAGGDDVGATALGRFAHYVSGGDYAMLYVANRFRNLVQVPADALENLREIQSACHLQATGIVSNAHLKGETTADTVEKGIEYACELADLAGLPMLAACAPGELTDLSSVPDIYGINIYIRTPWE